MAESKDTGFIVKSSEEMFEYCCSPCNDDGKTSEAKKFCVECGSHFCENCLRFHNKFPSLLSHQIVDSSRDHSDEKREGMPVPAERCITHHGKLIDMFCVDHDKVCCGTCIAVKHRACVKVSHLSDVAKGVKTSKEFENVKDSINEVLDHMKESKNKREENLSSLEREKNKMLQDIDKYQDDIIVRIKELAETARQQVRIKYEEYQTIIRADVDALETLITSINTNKQKLSVPDEAQLFVNVKAGQKAVKDGESVLSDMRDNWTNKQLQYSFDQKLRDNISSVTSFGIIEDDMQDVKEYNATLQGKYGVKQSADKSSVTVTGICPLEEGTILILDYVNCKLKRLNKSYVVQDCLSLNGQPIGICKTGKDEVAVSLFSSGRIEFVSVEESLKSTSCIVIDSSCIGITFDENKQEIFACCKGLINVYSKAGTFLRAYQMDTNGDALFSSLHQVDISAKDKQIVITDETKGLISLNADGKKEWTFTDQELIETWALCTLPNGNIFAAGNGSNNVLQIGKTGKKISVLIGAKEGLNKPYAIGFDRQRSQLIVGCFSNKIHVYTISKI